MRVVLIFIKSLVRLFIDALIALICSVKHPKSDHKKSFAKSKARREKNEISGRELRPALLFCDKNYIIVSFSIAIFFVMIYNIM